MAKITIDCADPNDFTSIIELAEQAAGRCNITYAKQAAALVAAGTCRSERAAAAKIAEETGENPETARKMIQRGKAEMGTVVPKKKSSPAKPKPTKVWTEEDVHDAGIACFHALAFIIAKQHPGDTEAKIDALARLNFTLGEMIDELNREHIGEYVPAYGLAKRCKFNTAKAMADVQSLLESWKGR